MNMVPVALVANLMVPERNSDRLAHWASGPLLHHPEPQPVLETKPELPVMQTEPEGRGWYDAQPVFNMGGGRREDQCLGLSVRCRSKKLIKRSLINGLRELVLSEGDIHPINGGPVLPACSFS